MKDLLFATTAIVAVSGFAGAAMAEVNLSGSAEMGIFYFDDDGEDADGNIEFHTDIDVTFTLAGATDSGLVFGASIDLDESDSDDTISGVAVNEGDAGSTVDDIEIGGSPAFDNDSQGGEEIFISGGFGRLTMGDTDGALDWALAEVGFNATAINDDHEHAGWSGNGGLDGDYDGQILRYDYTFGDFGIAVSGEVSDDDDDDGDDDPILGIGFRGSIDFAGNAIGFGLGYQNRDDDDAYGISVNGTIAGFQVGLTFTDVDVSDTTSDAILGDDPDTTDVVETDFIVTAADLDDDDFQHFGIGAGYNQGPISAHINYGIYDFDDGDEADGIGVTVGYELGDGLELQFGYGHSSFDEGGDDDDADDDIDQFSFGVAMNF